MTNKNIREQERYACINAFLILLYKWNNPTLTGIIPTRPNITISIINVKITDSYTFIITNTNAKSQVKINKTLDK